MADRIYKQAIVNRLNEAHIKALGERAFDGLYLSITSDEAITSYFAEKMTEEGYSVGEYAINLSLVKIDPATGKTFAI